MPMLSAVLAFILANPTVIAIVAGILAAFGWGVRQKQAGRKQERDKQARDRLESIDEAREIDDAITGRDPVANRKELGRWSPWGEH